MREPFRVRGRKRRSTWGRAELILVIGESIALVAALAAIPLELCGVEWAKWAVMSATVASALFLVIYAVWMIQYNRTPLMPSSVHDFRQVVDVAIMEQEGAMVDWDAITDSNGEFDWERIRDGGVPMDLTNWTRLRPDLRKLMEEGLTLQEAAQALATQNREANTDR